MPPHCIQHARFSCSRVQPSMIYGTYRYGIIWDSCNYSTATYSPSNSQFDPRVHCCRLCSTNKNSCTSSVVKNPYMLTPLPISS